MLPRADVIVEQVAREVRAGIGPFIRLRGCPMLIYRLPRRPRVRAALRRLATRATLGPVAPVLALAASAAITPLAPFAAFTPLPSGGTRIARPP